MARVAANKQQIHILLLDNQMTSPGQRELYTRAPFRGFLKDPDTDKASWSVIQSEKSEIQNCLRCQGILWHVSIYERSCTETR